MAQKIIPKPKAISIRVTDDLKDALDLFAMIDGRSTSSLVTKVLSDFIRQNTAQAKPASSALRSRTASTAGQAKRGRAK